MADLGWTQTPRQRILNHARNGPLQGTRAVAGVKAFVREQVARRVGHDHRNASLAESLVQVVHLNLDNSVHL